MSRETRPGDALSAVRTQNEKKETIYMPADVLTCCQATHHTSFPSYVGNDELGISNFKHEI